MIRVRVVATSRARVSVMLGVGLCLKLGYTICNIMTIAHQTSLSLEFSRQEYWSRLPCSPPGYQLN